MTEKVKILNNWHNWIDRIDKSDKDIYFKFLCLWMDFNSFYNYSTKDDDNNEFKMIKRSMADATGIYSRNRDIILSKFKEVTAHDNDGHRDYVFRHYNEDSNKAIFNDENNKIDDFLNVIYAVRCNLVHGHKIPEKDANKEVVEWAYDSLIKILSEYERFLNARKV